MHGNQGNRLKGLDGHDASVRPAPIRSKISIGRVTFEPGMVAVKASAPDSLTTERLVIGEIKSGVFMDEKNNVDHTSTAGIAEFTDSADSKKKNLYDYHVTSYTELNDGSIDMDLDVAVHNTAEKFGVSCRNNEVNCDIWQVVARIANNNPADVNSRSLLASQITEHCNARSKDGLPPVQRDIQRMMARSTNSRGLEDIEFSRSLNAKQFFEDMGDGTIDFIELLEDPEKFANFVVEGAKAAWEATKKAAAIVQQVAMSALDAIATSAIGDAWQKLKEAAEKIAAALEAFAQCMVDAVQPWKNDCPQEDTSFPVDIDVVPDGLSLKITLGVSVPTLRVVATLGADNYDDMQDGQPFLEIDAGVLDWEFKRTLKSYANFVRKLPQSAYLHFEASMEIAPTQQLSVCMSQSVDPQNLGPDAGYTIPGFTWAAKVEVKFGAALELDQTKLFEKTILNKQVQAGPVPINIQIKAALEIEIKTSGPMNSETTIAVEFSDVALTNSFTLQFREFVGACVDSASNCKSLLENKLQDVLPASLEQDLVVKSK